MMKNDLYPVFLKVSKLNVMIIGGGTVGFEKLSFLLKSSPNANVVVAAKEFSKDIIALAKVHKIPLMWRPYTSNLLHKQHMVIAATNDLNVNKEIHYDAKQKQLLVNVADTPDLCDFYLGGIVTKGNVKVAISTNGKSPTMAKRLRQFFEEVIPENVDDLVENLNIYRRTIKGNFSEKVSRLNKLTQSFILRTND
ncbi:precorrin-2 dehydrogenase/sirohydrochlorin ferrochelatase family protein [Urechidicola vernalis]|uniref:precorrin-2 dehydrogenase n=1 Tax=Urechidicola vernalis TaxID=3075600 RepID=A0ABU2Y4M6_9FLAO|nr:bifunctional precorrin-2 dehydrogenase/sirohydrochlorin ferrochelatase [Urechidicola sp. P050]MDT0553148.1 bifunctional precorrin-2 dehydrogenase/sirohydrochlorin ferrochelatase [Urechidicola sp. P050]